MTEDNRYKMYKSKREIAPNGTTLSEECTEVTGPNHKTVKKLFDELKNGEKK